MHGCIIKNGNMASNDEYQHQDFWKKFQEFADKSEVCIEQSENGECLMSAKWVILNLQELPKKQENANKNI